MKNYKIQFLMLIVLSMIAVISCEKEQLEISEETFSQTIPKEIVDKVIELHFNPNGIKKNIQADINGTVQEMYIIEGDIAMSYNQIMKMDIGGGIQAKQYRTNNLVSSPQTIRVVGYTGNNRFGLSNTAQTGLQYAINNYNNENLELRFQLSFGTNFGANDIVVYVDNNINTNPNSISGVAGFPSGGRPFMRVRINEGANTRANDQQLEHLMTHEIGHCVGFRHTDWDTRKTCGENTNEGVGNSGLVYIPGTAGPGGDPNSIMNACFSLNTNGEFSNLDRIALNYLY